jgi:diaminohydroxyphosphoribosylaminopyrimidine deaminase / 5-amino-6-(5-phosphoribosylamino)uracil reductase
MTESLEIMDTRFMREALRQARKGLGRTSPNPAVGAVVVKDGVQISAGYHKKAGLPHAEIEALKRLGGKAPGCTIYVTLEPCNHYGRTPPCAEAIVASGINRVVVGMMDANPDVPGRGCQFLRDHGIEVKVGVLEEECRILNEAFVKFITTKRPFLIAKSAITLDGWTGTSTGQSKWITNEKSRQYVQRLRAQADAVLVGVGTILADDPELTVRSKHNREKGPLRVIVDTHLRTPLDARVLDRLSPSDTLIAVGSDVARDRLSQHEKTGSNLVVCPVKEGRIDLTALMDILARRSITSILVEGGASVIGSMLRKGLVDKYYIFMAPKILGGGNGIPMAAGIGPESMDGCIGLKNIQIRRFGGDIMLVGYPYY